MAAAAAQTHSLFPQYYKIPFLGQTRINKPSHVSLRFTKNYDYKSLKIITSKFMVGIDLGTTNSTVAAMKDNRLIIIPNAEGQRKTPSVLAYTKDGDTLVGEIAKKQTLMNPANTFSSFTRFIKRKLNELDDEEAKQVSYNLVSDENGDVKLHCPVIGKNFAAEEISAQVVKKLVDDASRFLNEEVTDAVITVPDYFNDSQRYAMRKAVSSAGLDYVRVISESKALLNAYESHLVHCETILVVVCDLGSDTFDVSVLEVDPGCFEVLSTSRDTHLGGDDFDKRIVDWLTDKFKKEEGIDLLKDKQALQRLTETAEKAKIELSSLTETNISLPSITVTADGPKHINTKLTRATFEDLCSELLDRFRYHVEDAIKNAELSFETIDDVILVGGSTQIPAVQELVKKVSGKQPKFTVNPDEVVALGAAVEAGFVSESLYDDSPFSDIAPLDVTSLSLGLETLGGVMTKIIPRGTKLPTSMSQVFSTAADAQTSIEIRVFQGEREFVRDNHLLGSFCLDGIPPAPRGVPQIEVTFDIDANGVLSITAIEKATAKKQDITIRCSNFVFITTRNRLLEEAERFEKEDKKRDMIDAKNQAEAAVYETEKQLKELGDKVPDEVKDKLERTLKELKDFVSCGSTQAIKDTLAALNQQVMQLGQPFYTHLGPRVDLLGNFVEQ